MHLIRPISVLLLLGLAACGTPQGNFDQSASLPLTIDQPAAPFPYNSRISP